MKFVKLCCAAALLIGGMHGCAASTPRSDKSVQPQTTTFVSVPTGYRRIPLMLTGNGLCLVEAQANGQKLVFILDTGAQSTVIDERSSRRVGLRISPQKMFSQGIAKSLVEVRQTEPFTLTLGDATVRVAATQQDFTHIAINHRGRGVSQIDGLLGLDVMRAYKAIIDLREPAMYLATP